MNRIEKVAKEIVKLNDGWGGDFDYELLVAQLSKLDNEAYLVMEWIVDFVPEKWKADYFNINRRLIVSFYGELKALHDPITIRNNKIKSLLG
jgi:hypothetical protein